LPPRPRSKFRPVKRIERLFDEHAQGRRFSTQLEGARRVRDLHQPTRLSFRARSRLHESIATVTLLASILVSKSKVNDQEGRAVPLTSLHSVTQLSHGFPSMGACSCVTARSIAQRQAMESTRRTSALREAKAPAFTEFEAGNATAEVGDDGVALSALGAPQAGTKRRGVWAQYVGCDLHGVKGGRRTHRSLLRGWRAWCRSVQILELDSTFLRTVH
jgi:hypothetical protein